MSNDTVDSVVEIDGVLFAPYDDLLAARREIVILREAVAQAEGVFRGYVVLHAAQAVTGDATQRTDRLRKAADNESHADRLRAVLTDRTRR